MSKTLFTNDVHTLVDVSMKHIKKCDFERLHAHAMYNTNPPLVSYELGETGYLVSPFTGDDNYFTRLSDAGYSTAFIALVYQAKEAGHAYVMFSWNGAVNPDFPVFDW